MSASARTEEESHPITAVETKVKHEGESQAMKLFSRLKSSVFRNLQDNP